MYSPEEFKIKELPIVLDFLREHPLGVAVSSVVTVEPIVSHLPFLVEQHENEVVLESHLSIHNPQSEHIRSGRTILVIFQGPNAYISSSVYSHHNVPTWNYQAVHVYGTIDLMSKEELRAHLKKSVHHFDGIRHGKINFDELNPKMIESYIQEIKGFKVTSYRIETVFKLSQNRNSTDYENIIQDLASSENPADKSISVSMKKLK
jgi:transcriptional regulator